MIHGSSRRLLHSIVASFGVWGYRNRFYGAYILESLKSKKRETSSEFPFEVLLTSPTFYQRPQRPRPAAETCVPAILHFSSLSPRFPFCCCSNTYIFRSKIVSVENQRHFEEFLATWNLETKIIQPTKPLLNKKKGPVNSLLISYIQIIEDYSFQYT